MDFLKIYKHILPRAEAWVLTSKKRLRELFEGLSFAVLKTFLDNVWLDIFPQTTRDLDTWESNFGLQDYDLNDTERRARLDARWKEEGGQDPRYIEDTLRANGFDVYVHQWWVPGTEPPVGVEGCAEARNPVELLKSDIIQQASCGLTWVHAGNTQAYCGSVLDPEGYILVNKDSFYTTEAVTQAGDTEAHCGGGLAYCGFTITESTEDNHLTYDRTKWPFFLYIGGANFPELAEIDIDRRKEFEELCLKIRPLQQWLGMLIKYT